MEDNRLVAGMEQELDTWQYNLRPKKIAEYIGQEQVKNNLEALKLMNDSPYGLTASIWTENQDEAVKIGNQVNTGTWFMNRCDYLDPYLSWVGVKDSGRGCSLSKVGYEQLTRPKSFHLKIKH